MTYLTKRQLDDMGFKSLGESVKISEKASVYNCNQIEIGSNSRIDDFCVVSGKVKIGRNVHITPMCLIAGGEPGLFIEDFVTLAYGVKLFTQSDDYSGNTMTNSKVPKQFKNEVLKQVVLEKHTIVGSGTVVMPGVTLAEGTSVGAMSLVLVSSEPWTIIAGAPAKKIKARKKELLELEKKFRLKNI